MKMDLCLFTTLPPELVLNILESADSFAEVAALIRAARIFHDIWEHNHLPHHPSPRHQLRF